MTYISRAFWSSLRAKPSGTYVYRGYAAAQTASGKDQESASAKRSRTTSRRSSDNSPRPSLDSVMKREHSHDQVPETHEKPFASAEDVFSGVRRKLEEGPRVDGLSDQNRKALEEENAPIVRDQG